MTRPYQSFASHNSPFFTPAAQRTSWAASVAVAPDNDPHVTPPTKLPVAPRHGAEDVARRGVRRVLGSFTFLSEACREAREGGTLGGFPVTNKLPLLIHFPE